MVEEIVERVARKLGYVLKEEQSQVINALIREDDVFGVLPTGFGKSLCYGCLPLVFDEIRRGDNPSDCYHERSGNEQSAVCLKFIFCTIISVMSFPQPYNK